jgi:hypothetical protein
MYYRRTRCVALYRGLRSSLMFWQETRCTTTCAVPSELMLRRSANWQIVSELRLLPKDGEGALPDRNSWYSAGTSIRDGVPGQPPLYLWWKLGPTLRQLNQNETRNLITELDVVYGAGNPMYGFQTLDPDVTAGRDVNPVRIAFRRGPPCKPCTCPCRWRFDTYVQCSNSASPPIASQSRRHVQDTSSC